MDWRGTMERFGWRQEEVGAEPFHPLALQAQQARLAGQSVARISATVGTSQNYGDLKVSFTVSLDCIQTEPTINLASEAAFLKALELTNDAARMVGAQEIAVRQ